MNSKQFTAVVSSLMNGFREHGGIRVVVNFSCELRRQLSDGFVLNADHPGSRINQLEPHSFEMDH
jgi:hypothetical protein